MTMFITGGTSSIGRVLVLELANRGMPVRVLARKASNVSGLQAQGVELVVRDVTDLEAVRRAMAGCRQVTHLAALVGHNLPEAEWWQVNLEGSRNVLKAAASLQVESVVQVSTIAALNPTAPGEVADETRPVDTSKYKSLYQKTKHAADEAAREFAQQGLAVKIVYPTFGYGCSQAASHPSLHEQTLLRMAAGKPTAIMGSGRNRLCLAYYKDTVEGILLAHARGKTGESYILGNENLTFVEIWAAIGEVLGKAPPNRRVPLVVLKAASVASRLVTGKSVFPPDFFDMIGENWCFSHAKARDELGWRPLSFREGIAQTWKEYQRLGEI